MQQVDNDTVRLSMLSRIYVVTDVRIGLVL